MKKHWPLAKSESERNPSIEKIPQKNLSFFAFLRERNPYLFAHHPDHPAFQEHIWAYHGLYFCKGCTVTFGGIILGGIFYFLTGWLRWFSDVQIGFIFLAMLLPSVVTSLMNLPWFAKHGGRLLLGVLMTSAAIMVFITNSWAVRLAIVGIFLVVRTPLGRKRHRDIEALMNQFSLTDDKRSKLRKVSISSD